MPMVMLMPMLTQMEPYIPMFTVGVTVLTCTVHTAHTPLVQVHMVMDITLTIIVPHTLDMDHPHMDRAHAHQDTLVLMPHMLLTITELPHIHIDTQLLATAHKEDQLTDLTALAAQHTPEPMLEIPDVSQTHVQDIMLFLCPMVHANHVLPETLLIQLEEPVLLLHTHQDITIQMDITPTDIITHQ